MSATRRIVTALTLGICLNVASSSRASAGAACAGDCDGSGSVTVDEIVRLVAAALAGGIAECRAGDVDQSQTITIDEILASVTIALFGCDVPIVGPDLTRQFPRPQFVVGARPMALAVADINGDQETDITTVGARDDALSVLLHKQGGGFLPQHRVAVDGGPVDVGAATLGVNRTQAFLAANSMSNTLTATSYEEGAFETASFPVGESPVGLVVADLNGDSLADVVVANAVSNDVSVLLGAEDGGFATAMQFEVKATPRSLAAGDVDGDGMPDVLVALGSTHLSFLRNAAGGALESPVSIDVGVDAIDVEIADLDGDQVNDLIVLSARGGLEVGVDIVALVGGGDGSFTRTDELSTGAAPSAVTVADVDADGIADVIAGNFGAVSVFFGRGDGSFLDEVALHTDAPVSAVEVADADGDGVQDIVYAAVLDSKVSLFRGLGGREFAIERSIPAGGMVPVKLLSADVDDDGLADLATLNQESDDVSILRNLGSGTFADPVVVAAPSQLGAMAFGQFDHDRFPDLVVGYENRTCLDCVAAFRGIGDGAFDAPLTFGTMPRILALAAGRLGTGVVDDIMSLSSGGVSVLTGLGGLMFAPSETFRVGSNPRAMVVVDLNGDGFDDVATANAASVSILLASGMGTLLPPVDLDTAITPAYIDAADLNADGTVDLVVGGRGRLAVFFGLGGGGFAAERSVPTVTNVASFELADVNGDGSIDLVALVSGLAIYPGIATGIFAAPQRFGIHGAAADAIVADLNADGVADVATANAGFSGSISVVLGAAP